MNVNNWLAVCSSWSLVKLTIHMSFAVCVCLMIIMQTTVAKGSGEELRGVFLMLSDFNPSADGGKREIQDCMARLKDAGFNTILVWLSSAYLAALADSRYLTQEPSAAWDSLGFLLEEAANKHLVAWIEYSFTSYKRANSPEFDPLLGGNPSWKALMLADRVGRGTKAATYFRQDVCPVHPGARNWHLKLVNTALKRYPSIRVIDVEEAGYGYPGHCFCPLCMRLFEEVYGTDPKQAVDGPEATELKCLGTTAFMNSLRRLIGVQKPNILLSTNGGYSWKTDRRLGRDWRRWAELGIIDFYLPQLYCASAEEFEMRLQEIQGAMGGSCAIVPVIAIEWGVEQRRRNTPETICAQISAARENGARGFFLFPGKALTDEYLTALKRGPLATLPRKSLNLNNRAN